jgi:hypothetical protein
VKTYPKLSKQIYAIVMKHTLRTFESLISPQNKNKETNYKTYSTNNSNQKAI